MASRILSALHSGASWLVDRSFKGVEQVATHLLGKRAEDPEPLVDRIVDTESFSGDKSPSATLVKYGDGRLGLVREVVSDDIVEEGPENRFTEMVATVEKKDLSTIALATLSHVPQLAMNSYRLANEGIVHLIEGLRKKDPISIVTLIFFSYIIHRFTQGFDGTKMSSLLSSQNFFKTCMRFVSVAALLMKRYQSEIERRNQNILSMKGHAIEAYAEWASNSFDIHIKSQAIKYVANVISLIRKCSQKPGDEFDMLANKYRDLPSRMRNSEPYRIHEEIAQFSNDISEALFTCSSWLVKSINGFLTLVPIGAISFFNIDRQASLTSRLLGVAGALYVTSNKAGVGINYSDSALIHLPRILEALMRGDIYGVGELALVAGTGAIAGRKAEDHAPEINRAIIKPLHSLFKKAKYYLSYAESSWELTKTTISWVLPSYIKAANSVGKEKYVRIAAIIAAHAIGAIIGVGITFSLFYLGLIGSPLIMSVVISFGIGYIASTLFSYKLDVHYFKKSKEMILKRNFEIVESRSDKSTFFRAIALHHAFESKTVDRNELNKKGLKKIKHRYAIYRNHLKTFIKSKVAHLDDIAMYLAFKDGSSEQKLSKDLDRGKEASKTHIQLAAMQMGVPIIVHGEEGSIKEYNPYPEGIEAEGEALASLERMKQQLGRKVAINLFYRASDNTYHLMVPR